MIPSVYVAGASKELERAKYWIGALQDTGIKVTYDWTREVEKFGSCGAELTSNDKKLYARYDLRGIDAASAIWLLAPGPEATSLGMWIEFGYALNTFVRRRVGESDWRDFARPVLISPPVSDRCIFAALPQVLEFADDGLAFKFIQEWVP